MQLSRTAPSTTIRLPKVTLQAALMQASSYWQRRQRTDLHAVQLLLLLCTSRLHRNGMNNSAMHVTMP